jgi:hypothetical protein
MWGQGSDTRIDPVIRLVARITLAFFVLRALIHAGFMPDAKALAEGRLEIVICTSAGEKLVQMLDLDAPNDGAPKTSSNDCPFGLTFAKAFTAPEATAVPGEFRFVAAFGPAAAPHFRLPPALGPPLGQRAPPNDLA